MPYNDDGEWEMPVWMEPYRSLIEQGAGGNSAEDLMTRIEQEDNLAFSNSIVLVMGLQVEAKVNLLHGLKREGLLQAWETPLEGREENRRRRTLAGGFLLILLALTLILTYIGW